ncbi:Adenylate cyclase associated (CAP) C terminal [Carpediemonas membranifera]|uniref:Adenylate cyclase associated (CAP) C terminal n=1 Tax=Carpediemonas membranifera TaxID=201153 RepID=A0A8J6B831_9EUKA|nr:Adenylate cyclase associated (CAP) C terminal [Carpediemonas membranifera]|eukprot:KAG9395099.1 Adenylate cyclase associated (CAP) C terminal [Carpediemonas membranifera]
MEALIHRFENAVVRMETALGSSTAPAPASADTQKPTEAEIDPLVTQLDKIIQDTFGKIDKEAATIGEDVAAASAEVMSVLAMMRDFVDISLRAKKPGMAELAEATKPMFELAMKLADPDRRSAHYDHLKTFGEAMSALQWLVMDPSMGTPAGYVKEIGGSAMMYANRVRKGQAGRDTVDTRFATAIDAFFKQLEEYIRENFKTGLKWCPNGADLKSVHPAMKIAPNPPTGGGLFDAFDGKDPTTMMKHVTKDMKTKNQPKQAPVKSQAPAKKPVAAKKDAPARPPKTELVMRKWTIENYVGDKAIVHEAESGQSVYLYNLVDCVVQLPTKFNQLTVDNCRGCGIIVETTTASIEVINSKKLEVQINGTCPTMTIDNTRGIQVHLSETAAAVELHSSTSTDMNVLPMWLEEEIPVPQQFVHKLVDGKLHTTTEEHV